MTLFKIELEKTTNLGVSTLSKYFKGNGKAGFFNSTIIAVVALGLLIVGFTITATKTTFSWFGVLICLACMGLCSLAIQEWYIIFIETISLIVLVYTIINLTQKEYGEIA
jgi:CHASE2 domain-containing sensor protein